MSINTVSKMLIAFSVVMILMAMNMDTTVSTGYGRVNNFGLLNDQRNMLMLGGIGFIAGVILFATAKVKQTPEDELAEKLKSEERIQGVVQGVEQKFEKVSQVLDSVPNKAFNFLEGWLSVKRDNIPGRIAIFVFTSPLAIFTWAPLLIALGIYAYRPISASKIMTHLLYLHLVMDIFLAVMMAFVYSDNEPKAVWAIAVFTVLSILSYLAIRYIKRRELKNQLAES